jgi:ketosteroid isomerase-like protein
MSNLDAAREGYVAFGRGDLEAALALLDDDVEWIVPGTSAVGGVFRGKDEVLELWRRLGEREWRVTPEYWFADGDLVCALCHVTFAAGEMDTADLFRFRDGRVAKFQTAADTELLARAWPRA